MSATSTRRRYSIAPVTLWHSRTLGAAAMALTAVTVYAPGQDVAAVLAVAAVFGAINLPSVGSWAWMGLKMRRVLTSGARLRAFNLTMAALLIASLYPRLGSPAM